MNRILYGLLGIACGVMSLHYLTQWMQVRSTSGCYGQNACIQRMQYGGDTKSDRTKTIALFALAAMFVWMASSSQHDHHNH